MSLGSMAGTRTTELKKKAKATTTQLEVESRRMEERLRMLKEMMSAEKARREVEGGFRWEAGQRGPLMRKHRDQPASTVKATMIAGSNHRQKRSKEKIKVKILSENNCGGTPPAAGSESIRCGQCEKSTASLSCVECVENYCQVCYAKFHQKGALASHHAKPVVSKRKCGKLSPQSADNVVKPLTQAASSMVAGHHEQSSSSRKQGDSSLLDGSYHEEESAASFQQALAEWRAQAGRTSNEVQVCTTKDTEAMTKSSAGIQTGNIAVDKPKPRIQFTGKAGVTYFEQLMMKRHRYDPMFLSKSLHYTKRGEAEISSTDNERDLPLDEADTPSEFNIFYSCEEFESPANVADDVYREEYYPSTNLDFSVADTVEIVEVDVGQVGPSADPRDVTVEVSQPLAEYNQGPVKVGSYSKKMETKLSKTNNVKSAKKKQIQSSRPKSKASRPKSVVSRESSTTPVAPSSSRSLSKTSIQESVKKAWTQSSSQTKLSQFFLQGVEPSDNGVKDSSADLIERKYQSPVIHTSTLPSTIWLPDNSTSTATALTNEINPATDVPPLMFKPHSHNLTKLSHDFHIESDDDNDDIIDELGVSVSNVDNWDCERRERDEEDDQALENLAWELSSTIESEGRLTRCESEMEGDVDFLATTPTPQSEGEDETTFHLTDLSQVMSEFELYMHQQAALDQDSD